MTTLSGWPSAWHSEAPWARLSIAELMAASRSALARSSVDDEAIRRPSEETAMAAITPPVSCAKRLTSQLKFWASMLSPDAEVLIILWLSFVSESGQCHWSDWRTPWSVCASARAMPLVYASKAARSASGSRAGWVASGGGGGVSVDWPRRLGARWEPGERRTRGTEPMGLDVT